MPPRKRRQSNQGDENTNDRQPGSSAVGHETDKTVNRGQQKGTEGSSVPGERRLTARQQSKQDALLESAAAASAAGHPATTESSKKSTSRHTSEPTRFSTRIVKRPRRDLSPTESPAKKAAKKTPVPEVTTTPETKAKRHWELWSCEDKDSFFDGLCEHGKDFDSIHNLIVSKCKKRGGSQPTTVKNKEQVRHFYYRTWHKISKLIEPVEDLKKDIQELYGLISFGVLRKKMRGGINPNDKNWQKLNELVHFGATTIKIKGKKLRIKVPVCPALKKLNNIEEPRKDPGPKIPEKIRIEFRPRTNSAWSHVQEQAQNPRLRMTVRPDRCLSSLVRFLEQKWRPHRLKLKESLNEEEMLPKEFRVYPHRDSTVQCVNLETVDDPVLHFSLRKHRDAVQTSPHVNKGKKAKPKSTTPVPEPSDPKESVISDLSKPSTSKISACDTHCAKNLTSVEEQTCADAVKPCVDKEHTCTDISKTSCDDTSKSGSSKEPLCTGMNKADSTTEESCDADKTSSTKEKCCSSKEPSAEVSESGSNKEHDRACGCDPNCLNNVQDASNACNIGDKDSSKTTPSEDSAHVGCCTDKVPSSHELRESKSWQNMCSVKPSCKQCSSNDFMPTSPHCDNIKSSLSSELIALSNIKSSASSELIASCNIKSTVSSENIGLCDIKSSVSSEVVGTSSVIGGHKEVIIETTQSGASIRNTRTYSTPDLSAFVDGENAMFPDAPLESYSEMKEIDSVEKNQNDGRRNDSPSIETDTALDENSPSKSLCSPTNEDCLTRDSVQSSHSEIERVCRDIVDRGWNVSDSENVKMAELYLMFGKGGEIRFEYDWCNLQANELQERLLSNLDNMLRRLANLAMVEFTDFSKTPNAGSPCHMCGTVLGGKQAKNKEKGLGRSPPVKPRATRSCRDMSTQTQESPVLHKKEPANMGLASTVSASPDGVFRVPAASPALHPQKSITTLTDRELVQHLNPGINKQLMRPRKLKSVSRKPMIQRTILPKSQPGQMVTFYPVVANSPGPPGTGVDRATSGVSQTIVGHPMGIQTQSGSKGPGVNQTIVGHPVGIQTQTVPISMVPTAASSQQLQTTSVQYVGSVGSPTVSSTTISSVELSLSPGDADQTLMRIPESQIGSMSQEALKAAGLSTVPMSATTSTPLASKPVQKGSISPPNLSSLLDISFSSMQPGAEVMDLNISDNSFTGLLEEKSLSVDPGLTTPPIRSQSDQRLSPLHSPPVRSLFKMNSPVPDQQWLNGEVADLSLTSFLESPSKPAYSVSCTQTTSTFNSQPLTLFNDSSRDSQSNRIDVDSTLQCMMNESSIDYVRKFADLAEQIAQGDAVLTQTKPDIINSHTVKELT